MDKSESDPNSGGLDEDVSSMPLDDKGESCKVPVVGMKVNSEEEAYNLYNNYAVQVGFSIRKSKTIKDTNGALRQRYFVCSKEGLRLDEDTSKENRANKLETRTNCKASIRFLVKDGIWEVTHFNPEHNHELASPEQRKFLRSNRRVTADMIKNMVKAGMTPMQAYSFYTKQAGVADNAKMTPRDCYNLLRKERLSMIKEGDAQPDVNQHKEAQDCSMQSDDKGEGYMVPAIGMKVRSEEEAYNLYNNYAVRIGFSIRKSKTIKDTHGALRQRYFVCSKEGLRVDADTSRENKVNRLETRTNCKASIRFMVKGGIWEVTYFNPDHNHELAPPEQRKFLRSNWQISAVKDMVNTDINPVQTDPSCIEQAGEVVNASVIKGADAQAVANHFKQKQASDPMFFYSMNVDEEGRIMDFFWRDGRSKIDYDCLGDVVTFDTTLRTNKQSLLCALFVGVNQHREDIYFGCAFLSNETIFSFTWLFETFLESMGGKKPKMIFTDQGAAMEAAIKHVFPDTCHRLCIWHFAHTSLEHISTYVADPDFKTLFDKCLSGCLTEEQFESNWNLMINGFHLNDNTWLSSLYDLREKWCPTFNLDKVAARIRSMKRSEYTNNVLKSMSSKNMNLVQFVHEYEAAVKQQRFTELEHDFRCQNLPVSNSSGLLNEAANVYTVEIFHLFQKEMLESLSIVMEEISNDGSSCSYEVSQEDHSVKHKVVFSTCDMTVLCSCKMFESMGILCRHALRVLNLKGVTNIPPQYILRRWTKCAKQWAAPKNIGDSSCNNAEASPLFDRIGLMQKAFYVIDRSLMVIGGSKVVDEYFDQSINEVEKSIVTPQNEEHDQPISKITLGDSSDNYSSLNESRILISHPHPAVRPKNGNIKRRTSKSATPSGKEKKHISMPFSLANAPSTEFPHPPYLSPSIPTSSLGMISTSCLHPALQQQQFRSLPIGDSNSHFDSMFQGTNPVVHENQFTRMLLGTNPNAHTSE